MERVNKNSLYEKLLLTVSLVYLIASSFYVSVGETDSKWIPIIAGLVDTEVLLGSKTVSFFLSFVSVILMVLSVSLILRRTMGTNFNIQFMTLFMLLIIFSDSRALYFNQIDRKSTRLNSSHQIISYAVFC